MDLINSCQLVTHSLLVHQPYQWYAALFLILIVIKAIATVCKTYSQPYHRVTKLPAVLKWMLLRQQFSFDRVTVLDTNDHLAFTRGLFAPQIFLSTGLINNVTTKQLEAILLHEIYHAQHFHPLRLAVSKLINSLCAFLPVVDDLVQYYGVILETQADNFAYTQQRSRRYLKEALSIMMARPQLATAVYFTTQPLEQRLQYLVKGVMPRLTLQPLKVLSTFLVILAGFWYSQQWHHAQALEAQYNVSRQCRLTECLSHCVQETWFTPAPLYSVDTQN